jgi:transcriptional regulator with XRE-family HTH domain
MDFKDASARFKKLKEGQETEATPAQPVDFVESYRIRGKMVGVLLRDARRNAGRSIEECAQVLKISPAEVEAWEYGDQVPSLPQLELLAYFLGVPVSHFWGSETLEASQDKYIDAQTEYLALRNRMVGALLRQARQEANLSLEALSQASGLPVEQINSYELGEIPLPMHELTVLANAVKKNLRYFLESSSHVGEWLEIREEWKHFTDLPEDVRRFAANPRNLGFINIAYMLSQMPTDKLREIGESMLNDITM